jgi:RNA polymerase sigma-70 factor (ECF subfamily)
VTKASPTADQSAFDKYVVPEIPVLYRVALSLAGQPADAEDLVQDTLIRAYRAIDRFDGAFPRAWLLTILRHTHLNRVRVRSAVLLSDGDAVAATMDRLGTATPAAEEVVVSELFEVVVAEAMSSLPEKHRQVIQLVDIEGWSYQEAADRLGVPRGTVMSRLHRARTSIRAQLAAAGLAPRKKGM